MGDLTRRATLAASAGLPWATTQAVAGDGGSQIPAASKTLVAYFTRSGNTKVIAGTVQRDLKADLFEIRPAQPYPEDYEETVAQAQRETERRYEPPLAATGAEHRGLRHGLPRLADLGNDGPRRSSAPSCERTISGARRSGRSSPTVATALGTAWQ